MSDKIDELESEALRLVMADPRTVLTEAAARKALQSMRALRSVSYIEFLRGVIRLHTIRLHTPTGQEPTREGYDADEQQGDL
jgi:hypothetical protein